MTVPPAGVSIATRVIHGDTVSFLLPSISVHSLLCIEGGIDNKNRATTGIDTLQSCSWSTLLPGTMVQPYGTTQLKKSGIRVSIDLIMKYSGHIDILEFYHGIDNIRHVWHGIDMIHTN